MQSEKIYRFRSDKRTALFTALYLVVGTMVALGIYHLYIGGYFSAWFISVAVAIIALMALSIPRRLILSDDKLTVVCLLEIVEIPTSEIVSVRRIEKSEARYLVPLFGSYGLFGYFGYYLDLATFERVKMHATELNNLVEIVDIYDDRYYVSCREAEDLIQRVELHILPQFKE